MLQLGRRAIEDFEKYCQTPGDDIEEKLKIIMMEIGMMFDLLYTKTMVLQRLTGRIFRCAAQISMVVAFVFFLIAERQQVHNQNRANIAVSYTLFVGAIFMEVCSIATEITSPWTRAHLKEDSFLHHLFSSSSSKAFCDMKAIIQCKNNNVQWLSSSQYCSIGQFNFTDFSISHASTSTVTCKVVSALGLRKQWGNLWFMKRVEAQGIARYFVEWFDRKSPEERFRPLRLGRRLNYTLCLPFEHALYRLHIYTDLHVSRHFDDIPDKSTSHADDVMLLKEECEKLSNYMCYLKSEYPSMLPISSEVRDGTVEPEAQRWKKNCGRLRIVEHQAGEWYNPSEPDSACPFEPVGESEADLKQSLEEIREMWMRLLVYAAGKCSGEQHARQLSKGGELLTFVWLLILHHGLGDAATEVKLLTSDDPNIAELGSVVAAEGADFARRPEEPRYAFDFRQRQRSTREADERQQLVQLASTLQHVVPQVLAQGMMENGQELISELIQQLLSGDSKDHSNEAPAGASPERDQLQLARQIEHTLPQLLAKVIEVNATEVIDQINKQFLSGERQDTTSSEAEKEDDTPQMSDGEEETREGTPPEIVDEEVVSLEVERQQHLPAED
ncbi:hypothetical protein HU200_051115 [Digitaria exilis]|uniref:DUF4220 domain-containing protein n=1 Tax=Digitaria exilis TaxID=1010633 RepID=A0A835ASJ5_9POAL|nr:hypothetical protein HU200_051115 [Digitaria exilis]